MEKTTINLLDELNDYSGFHSIDRDDVNALMLEFSKRITNTLNIERISAWLFNPKQDRLISIGEYDTRDASFKFGTELSIEPHLNYFKAIKENRIILAPKIRESEQTKEFNDHYSIPNDIISLMDIPLRISGELIGVLCFEKTGSEERIFTEEEQVFALSIGIVLASNLEARQRRSLQHKLDIELKEKETLLNEIHHRVKNNLSVVSSLIGLQAKKTKDAYHFNILNECREKIYAIAEIHELIYENNSFSEIKTLEYFPRLLNSLIEFYSSNECVISLESEIDEFILDLEQTVPLALIINEVVTNCYKHAFKNSTNGKVSFSLTKNDAKIRLIISDNGNGFSNQKEEEKSYLGMEIINGLVEQLDGIYDYSREKGSKFELTFRL